MSHRPSFLRPRTSPPQSSLLPMGSAPAVAAASDGASNGASNKPIKPAHRLLICLRLTPPHHHPLRTSAIPILLLLAVLLSILLELRLSRLYERESKLDFWYSYPLKPFYALTCPKPHSPYPARPRANQTLHVISGRSPDQTAPIDLTWTAALESGLTRHRWDGNALGSLYANSRCRSSRWEHRLTYIYQSVFTSLLSESPDDVFFFVEDDVALLDWGGLRGEMERASWEKRGFFSFDPSPGRSEGGCVYEFGSVAFAISRGVMANVVNVGDDLFCRMGVDIMIARWGPWYGTRERVVEHVGMERYQSPS